MDENNISEEISSNYNSAELIDHTCDDNGKNTPYRKKADFTSINTINATNDLSMNDDNEFIHKY